MCWAWNLEKKKNCVGMGNVSFVTKLECGTIKQIVIPEKNLSRWWRLSFVSAGEMVLETR